MGQRPPAMNRRVRSSRTTRAVLLTLVSLLVASVAAGIAQAQSVAEQELAEKWAPVLRLKVQEEMCGKGEPYEPVDVNVVLDNPEVVFRGPWDKVNVARVAPTADDLSQGLTGYHLDFPGEALEPKCDYEEWQERLAALAEPTMYARTVTEPTYPGRLALQYWFFYVFNDFNNKHEGDWEMIQLNFDAASAEEALTQEPAALGYSQHESAEQAEWGAEKLTLVDGTHPVVYPASGSHANYFTDQLFLGRSAAQGVGCDDSTGPSRDLRPQVAVIPSESGAYLTAFAWLAFEGHWGELEGPPAFFNGPTGPNTKPQWTAPIGWSEETWRSQAFPLPGGETLLPEATTFFCQAVEAGGSLLIKLTQSPLSVFFFLVALLGVFVWAATRTRWRPSTPHRLQRRRATGQLLSASRRMYGGHVRLFAGIGLVFIPIAILVVGLQAGLFLLTSLDALTDTAGEENAAVSAFVFGISLIFNLIGLALVQAVVARAMVAIDRDQPITAWTAYREVFVRHRLRTLVGAVLLIVLVVVPLTVTFFLIPVAVWILVRWSLTAQAVEIDGLSARASLRRSFALVRGHWWRTGLLVVGVSLVAAMLGPFIGALAILGTSAAFWVANLIAGIIYVFAFPFVAIVTTYIYYDRRVRQVVEPETAEVVLPDELPAEAVPGETG